MVTGRPGSRNGARPIGQPQFTSPLSQKPPDHRPKQEQHSYGGHDADQQAKPASIRIVDAATADGAMAPEFRPDVDTRLALGCFHVNSSGCRGHRADDTQAACVPANATRTKLLSLLISRFCVEMFSVSALSSAPSSCHAHPGNMTGRASQYSTYTVVMCTCRCQQSPSGCRACSESRF